MSIILNSKEKKPKTILLTTQGNSRINREELKNELFEWIQSLGVLYTILNNKDDMYVDEGYLLNKIRLIAGGTPHSEILDPDKEIRLNMALWEIQKKVIPYADRFHIYKANSSLGDCVLRYEDDTRPGDFKFSDVLFGTLEQCRVKLQTILDKYRAEGVREI